jgi:undecaprenyl-diphosphatase
LEAAPLTAGGTSPGWVSAAGFIAAFFSGALACRWMIQLVRKLNLGYFAFYCLAAGLLASIFLR